MNANSRNRATGAAGTNGSLYSPHGGGGLTASRTVHDELNSLNTAAPRVVNGLDRMEHPRIN